LTFQKQVLFSYRYTALDRLTINPKQIGADIMQRKPNWFKIHGYIRIPQEKRLRQLAQEQDRNMSSVLRAALDCYFSMLDSQDLDQERSVA